MPLSRTKRHEPAQNLIEQCEAARGIESEFGTLAALAYLIGEKFLKFLEAANEDADSRGELPAFVAEIKAIFQPWQWRSTWNRLARPARLIPRSTKTPRRQRWISSLNFAARPPSCYWLKGLGIGDGKHVDLFRYAAWLVHTRHTAKPEPQGDPYEALKERARERNAAIALAGRDIGALPDVVDLERNARAARDFQFFCDTYFSTTFHLPWSEDHTKVIRKIEKAVIEGGLFAMAMPRGSGKSSLRQSAFRPPLASAILRALPGFSRQALNGTQVHSGRRRLTRLSFQVGNPYVMQSPIWQAPSSVL